MKTQIYYLKLIDDKEFICSSRLSLSNQLKKYVVDNNKVDDRWYYPTKNQLDNLYGGRVKEPHLFFVDCFKWCLAEELFNIDVNTRRENGKEYTNQYIRLLKNNHINKQLKVWNDTNNHTILDMTKFTNVIKTN